jgi:hypothetical protein
MWVVGQRHANLPLGNMRYPLYMRLGGPQGWSGQVRKISPPLGFDPRTVQPVASRYTDWDIPARILFQYVSKRITSRSVAMFNILFCWLFILPSLCLWDASVWISVLESLQHWIDRHTEAVSSFFQSLSLNTDLLPPMRRLKGVFEMFGTWLYGSACSTFRWSQLPITFLYIARCAWKYFWHVVCMWSVLK